jgi:hypothetical protein
METAAIEGPGRSEDHRQSTPSAVNGSSVDNQDNGRISNLGHEHVDIEESAMEPITRRGFLGKTTLGAAAAGALLTVPTLAGAADASPASTEELEKAKLAGPLVAHVRNISTGEVAVMLGTREFVFHDRRLVARLVKAAR